MKAIVITLAILGSATSALAAAECPQGSTTKYSCTSTPADGDSIEEKDMFESIAVCVEGAKTSLVADHHGKPESAEVQVESRPGGVSYTVALPEVSASLQLPVGLSPDVTQVRGTFVRDFFADGSEKATYTCDIVR